MPVILRYWNTSSKYPPDHPYSFLSHERTSWGDKFTFMFFWVHSLKERVYDAAIACPACQAFWSLTGNTHWGHLSLASKVAGASIL